MPRPKASNFVGMSTIEDLSYTPSAEERSRNASQIADTGRRNWKTIRGRGEAVWPPHLEAALLEGLEKYKPDESRRNKAARFPLRNKFISDYVFETTGKRRTPKQVGSRLQQLRDTCKGEKITQLLSRGQFLRDTTSDRGHSLSAECSPTSSTRGLSPRTFPSTFEAVYVEIIVGQSTWPSLPPVIDLANASPSQTPIPCRLSPVGPISSSRQIELNCLQNWRPEVVLSSPYAFLNESSVEIFVEGSVQPRHCELVTLNDQTHPQFRGRVWHYGFQFTPSFWKALGSYEPHLLSRYQIVQQVKFGVPSGQNSGYLIHYQFSDSRPMSIRPIEIINHNPMLPNAHFEAPNYLMNPNYTNYEQDTIPMMYPRVERNSSDTGWNASDLPVSHQRQELIPASYQHFSTDLQLVTPAHWTHAPQEQRWPHPTWGTWAHQSPAPPNSQQRY